MKFKVLTIDHRNLEKELEAQYKLGFEVFKFIEKIMPNSSSDFSGWKILFRSIKR